MMMDPPPLPTPSGYPAPAGRCHTPRGRPEGERGRGGTQEPPPDVRAGGAPSRGGTDGEGPKIGRAGAHRGQ